MPLNTTEMVHGAFGLEGEAVVIVHALELENLDLNEMQAVIDDMSMAVAKHQPSLAHFARPFERRRRRPRLGHHHGNLFQARHPHQVQPERSDQQGGRPAEDAESDRRRDAEPAGRGEEAGRHLDRRREAPQEAVGRAGRSVGRVGAQGDAGGARRRRRAGQGGARRARASTTRCRPSSASSGSCRRTRSRS